MLQPDKSAKRVIAEGYNRQFEEMSNADRALLEAKIKFSDQTAQIQNVYSQDQLDNFTREGLSPSLYADMDKLLGQSQSGFDRGFNVFARGLAKAPSAFLEPIGYGVDYIANNVFGEVAEGDEDFTNSFNDFLKEYEKSVDDAFPVFTGDIEDEPSVFQAGWWVKNGDQIIRSLGYYPYGMVAGRVLGAGLTGLLTRGAASSASVQTATQIANQARNIERTSRGLSAIGTGVTQNYAEHMHSAASIFQENYEDYKKLFAEQDPQATKEDVDLKARIKAGHDASNVVKMGRWNLLFEIPTNYMLFRSPATTRALQGIAGGGRKAATQRLGMAVFEPTQEAGEEIWTGFLEKEGRRQVGLEKGYYKQDHTTMFDRWANHALSYEGYTEGLSGAIGGGIFTGYSLAFADNKARKVQLEQEKVNAAFANDMAKYRNLNEQSLFETFRSNAQKGTYESMIKHFEDIANLTPKQASDRGLDEDYKEKAQGAIKKALDYEADYNANIFTYKDPVKAEILTRSKYVQNYLNDLITENEGKLTEAKSESASYIDAQGLPAEMVNVFDATSKIEALRASVDKITSDINEATAAVKNNKERTLDKGETAADMQNRLDIVQKQLDEAILSQEEAINILKDTSGLTDEQIASSLIKAFKPGTPLYNQAVAEESVIDTKSRYATEVDRYSNFIENPSTLNSEAKNIKDKAAKIEKARKENVKKQKAQEKAEKQQTKVNAKKQQNVSDKVEGEGSTKENIKNKETSKAALDEILAQSQEAPDEIKLEAEASINEQLDKILEGDVESMKAYQMMLEGQLSEEQLARLQEGIQAKENNKETAKQTNVEQTANTVEVANASSNNKSIGESAAGDRQVKNFNYDKNNDGSIPFERQDSTTEEQDKKQLTRETKNSLPNKPDSRIKIATKQIIDGANAIAYLAVDYVSKLIDTPSGRKFIRQTASKDKTKTLVPEVESPNHLGPGTTITLRAVKEGSKGVRYIYDEQGMPKEVTWKYSDFIKPGGQINSDQIPIEIVAEVQGQEKVIGYVHDTDWVDAALVTGQPRNIAENEEIPDNWNFQKNEIRALRKDIIDKGGEVTTTISEVSTGTPFLNVVVDEQGNPTGETEWQDVKALMPDFKNLRLSFRQVGKWVTNPNKPVKEFISNNDKEYSDGRIALVLPTKKKDEVFVAPLWTKPLNNEQIETIINAAGALEDSAVSKKISDDLGFNFSKSNPAALSTLINRTVYTQRFEFDPSKPSETVYIDANPNNNMIMIATEGNRVIYTNKPDSVPKNLVETKSSIQPIAGNEPAVRKILQTLLPSINIKEANTDGQYVNAIISSNEKGVQYDSKKYDSYNSYAFELVQTNINGTNSFTGADGQQEYVYVNQPVIQFSKEFEAVSKPEPVAEKDSKKPNQLGIVVPNNVETDPKKFRNVTKKDKQQAVKGNEDAQIKWMTEEVSEFYEAVEKDNLNEIYDEAIGLIRTAQQFESSKGVSDLYNNLVEDLRKVFPNEEVFRKEFDKWKKKKTAKNQAKGVTADTLLNWDPSIIGKPKLGSLFQGLIDDADYSVDFSIEPVAGEPELPFEENEKFYNRLDPFFIDFNSIDYSRQKQILDFTTYFVTKSFINNPEISVNESIEAARQIFVSAKNSEDFENKSDVIKRDIATILQNWEKVTALTKEQLNSVHNIKEGKSRDRKDLEKDSFKDEARWQSNPKKKASARMKTKLSAILRRNSKGEPILNYLEQPTFYSFDEVWGNLKGILTESLPNIDSMLEQMDAKGAVNPMFKEIARYIRSDRFSEQERSEFVAEFANAYISQKMTIFSKDNAGNFSGEIIDSAANKESNTVRDRWLIQQFENPNLVKFSKDGEAYIDSEYAKKVETDYKEEFNNIKDSYKGKKENMLQSAELAQLLHNTLTKLSIVVPVEAFQHLATPIERSNKTIGDDILGQAWGYAVDPRSPKGFMTRIFKGYTTNAPKLEDIKYDPEVQENAKPLFANNALKGGNFQAVVLKLAELTAKFGDPIYAISYRDGEGKAVYPYNGTTSMHVLLKLYENYDNDAVAKNLVDNIKATHMGSVSRLLDEITQEKGALKINYTDALKDKYGNEARAAKRKHQGILQQNINSMWQFQNQNKGKGYFFGVTKADRGISELIEHKKIDFKDQIKIEDNKVVGIFKTAEDYLYSYALGEVKRIYDTQNKLDSDPTYLQDDKKYREGSQYFHFFPFLNKHELEKSFTEEEVNTVYPAESFDGIPKIDIVAAEPILRKAINEFATSIINESIAEFTELNLTDKFDKSYMASLGKDTNAETKTAMAVGDLELNYIISNIEQQILFGGDIAEAYNGKGATAADKIQSARSNYQKRLIGSDAPKIQGNYKKREYTAITLNDRLSYSKSYAYYDKLFGTGSPYGNPTNKTIESTDALELTTVQEHIDMLNFFGQIDKEVYDSISNKINNAIKDESNTNNYYELTEQEMAFALRPVKPQYDFMHPDPKTGRLSRVYRKSMSIPLLPDMTSDFQLDNLRIAMENTGVARAGHKTSDKLSPYKTIDAYDANGDILPVDQLTSNIEDNGIFTLYRDGLGIQQEKNVKLQQLIALSTQKSKVMFAGLLDKMFKIDGKEILGEDLRKRKEEIVSLIYKLKHDKVLKRFGNIQTEEGGELLAVDGSEVQLSELVSALKEEAKARNWNINDIFSLELKKDGSGTLVPLPFIQSRRMLEGLMLSVVNKIANVKIPGITYVQSSSAGFKSTAAWSEVEGSMRNQVITTTSFNEAEGLQGPRWDEQKGEVIPGQVMVKFFYKDEDGNELDIMAKDKAGNYIFLFEKNNRLFLNPNTVPADVRHMIGYRIPYQNLASEMPLEIVGFLPKNMEITAIVPDEMLPQMGSDFDVDTLNSIIAQYIVTKDTDNNIKGVYRRDRVKNANKFTDEMLLLDELRDIFWSVITTNKDAYDKMSKGIDDPALENIAEDVDKILNANVRPRTAISRIDQIRDNISQRAGQVLIGPGAQANTLNAIFEGKNIHLATLKKSGNKTTVKNFEILGLFTEETYKSGPKKGQYKPLKFSDLSGENKSVYYKKGKKFFRTSSDVINIKLNAAIDNANKPTLGKLNFTMDTLPTSLFMDMGGVPIEISGYMMPQEIMRDYTRELDKIVQGLSDKNVFERKSEAEKVIMEKYQKLAKLEDVNEVEAIVEEFSNEKNENFEMLFQSKELKKQLIIGAPNSGIEKDAKYYQKQIAIFKKFKKFEAFSDTLNKPRKAINDPSVRGLQSTIASAKSYIKRFNDVFNVGEMDFVKGVNTFNSGIAGLKSLENTEYAKLAKYLTSGFTLFNNVYPTDTQFIRDIEEAFINNTGSTEVSENVSGALYDGIISNGWSYALEQVFIKERKEANSLYELRRKLFVEDNNIAVQTSEAQKTDWGKTNEFVMALTPYYSTNKNKGKAAVGIDWSSNIDNIAMQRGFTALFLGNAEAQEFAKNLLMAAYLNGGNQKASSYLNMIPFGALENLGLTKQLSDNMFREEGITSVISYLTQVIQHNPWYATEIDIKDKKIRKHVTVQEDNKVITGLILPDIDKAKDLPALENFMYLAEGKAYYKNFLTYPIGKTYYLFTLESSVDNGIYFKRIDLKGDKFGTEYDHTGNTFSYLEDNKVIKTVKDPIPDGVPPVGVPWHEVPMEAYEDAPGINVMDPIEDYNNRKDNYDDQLDALMDTIINDGEEGTAELARLYKTKGIYKSLPFKGVEVLDKIKRTERGIVLGSYSNPTQKIEIYQGSLDLAQATPSRVAKTMLHEATHYFTNPALRGEDTSPAAKRFKRSMEALLEKAKREFESSEEYQKARTQREKTRKKRITYGLSNVRELVAGMAENKHLQEFLNNIPYEKDSTLFEKIKNTVKKYFLALGKQLGFDIKEGSALDVGINEMLMFLQIQDETVQDPIPEPRTPEKDTGELAGIIGGATMVLDSNGMPTGEVIVDGPQTTPTDKLQNAKNKVEQENLRKLEDQGKQVIQSILQEHSSEWQKKDTGRVTEDGQKIEKYYHMTNPNVETDRVSEFYKKDTFTGDTKLRDTAVNIGNKADEIVRKVMANQNPEVPKVYNKVVDEIAKRRDKLIADGYKIISDEIVVGNTDLGVAGTTDIIAVNKDKQVKIIDVKTVRNGTSKLYERGTDVVTPKGKEWYIDKWTNQLNMYRVLAERIGPEIQVESLEILPIRVDYEIGAEDPSYAIVEKGISIEITEPTVDDANVKKFQRWLHRSKSEIQIEQEFPNSDSSILQDRLNPITYTDDQTKALLIAADFIKSDSKEMLLAGYAGTGKTTILENIIKYAERVGKSIYVTAPTNKAVLVIERKLKSVKAPVSRETNLLTNHQFLYGTPDESGKFVLSEKRLEDLNLENAIHIMDEASMLSEDVMKSLNEFQDRGLKTIYVGDGFQLPPVGKDPNIFTDREFSHSIEMTEVKRQSLDSSVLTVATNMRNTKEITIPSTSVSDFKVNRNKQETYRNWLTTLKEGRNTIMLAASNPARITANKLAREVLYGKDADVIEDGEVLIVVANGTTGTGGLINSYGEEVKDVANGEIIGEDRSKTYTKHPQRPEKTTIYYGTGKYYKPVTVQAVLDERGNTILLFPDSKEASMYHGQFTTGMFSRAFKIDDPAKLAANLEFFEPFIETTFDQKTKREKKVVKDSVIMAYYGYAITGHKSQGSQWDKVFVDHGFSGVILDRNTGREKVIFDPARWLYTAITRAENEVEMTIERHHKEAPISSIKNAVNSQVASQDVAPTVETPQAQHTFESVVELAVRELAGYRLLESKGTREEMVEAFRKRYNNDVQAFLKDVEQEIIEKGQTDYSIVSDTIDMPVNAHGEIAEVVQSINGRIKALQRRKTLATSVEKRIYLDSQIDSLKDDIEKLKEGNNTYVIEDVALRQLEWAKNILERPRLSLQEMADASRMVDIWSFKNTKHLLSEEQAKDKNNPTRKTFEDIGNIASSVELTMAAKMKEWVKNYVEQVSGEPLTDESMSAFLDMQDEGWFRGYFIDASGFVNPVARAADGALKTVARNAEDSTLNEVTDIQKKFKDLRAELRKLNISEDIFLQKDKDGNKTGYFASKFNESYYKDLGKVHSKHKKELERIIGSTRLTVDQIRQERFESFKNLYEAKNSMEEVIDIRFWTKNDHTAGELKSKQEYIQYLNDTFGETVAKDLIGQAENSLSRYNLEELAHRRKVATDLSEGVIQPAIGLTLQETAESIHKRWVNKNNPELYLNQRLNTTAINIGYGTAGWKYTITYPRPERTEYFNNEFSIIENNNVLSDFYLFWTDSMARYKSYLPEVAVNEMSENFFPTIQKDLLEEYMNRGAIAALSYLGKDTKLYGALFADETLTLNRENEGLKAELDERGVPVSKVPLRFLGSENVEIEDRAFDMERVMVMFAGMAMNYKFKSEAEPLVDILMRTVREATKPYLDSRGKKFKRWGSDKNITIKSGPQVIQEALDYAQQSIMYGRSREKVSKTSLELPGNFSKDILSRKRRAEELKKQYDELNDKLVDGTITKAQFNTAAESLEKEFKELNIKAFSFNKLIRGFVSYTQLKGLGWNLSAGIANVGFGMLASSIHAAGEEDYTSKELGKALRIVIASAVNPSSSKAAAIMRRMNLLFEMREITYGSPAARGDKKFKLLGKVSPMYIQQSTEFVVQGMSAIAKMLNTTVVDLQGNERNLYEAFNKDATWNVEEFGYQKEWDFNNLDATTRNSYTKFRDAAIEMNKKLHGNYDPNSLVKVKSKDFNLLFTIFRTWAFEGFNTRYSKKIWNDQLGRYTKGRYNSIFDVGIVNSSKIMMKILLKRVTRQSTDSIMSGVEDNLDAINLKKTFAAMKAQITIMALGIMLKGLADDTDDEEALSDPALKALLNILFRVEQDLSYYRNPATFISVFKDPSPALKTITDVTRAFDGTQRYILKDDYRGDHPMYKWGKVFPLTNQIYKWTIITEKDLDTSYGLSDYIEDEYFKDED